MAKDENVYEREAKAFSLWICIGGVFCCCFFSVCIIFQGVCIKQITAIPAVESQNVPKNDK